MTASSDSLTSSHLTDQGQQTNPNPATKYTNRRSQSRLANSNAASVQISVLVVGTKIGNHVSGITLQLRNNTNFAAGLSRQEQSRSWQPQPSLSSLPKPSSRARPPHPSSNASRTATATALSSRHPDTTPCSVATRAATERGRSPRRRACTAISARPGDTTRPSRTTGVQRYRWWWRCRG